MSSRVLQRSVIGLKQFPNTLDRSCDIIESCHGRYLNHVLEQIWLSLDFESLINAQQVSTSWQSAVNDVNLWPKYLKKQLSTNSDWERVFNIFELNSVDPELFNDGFYCKLLCRDINSHLEILDENLRTGCFTHRIVPLPSHNDVSVKSLCMNDRYIVAIGGNFKMYIWDRRTLTIAKVFDDLPRHPWPINAQIDGNMVVWAPFKDRFYILDIERELVRAQKIEEDRSILSMQFKNNLLLTQIENSPVGNNQLNVYQVTENINVRKLLRKYFTGSHVLDQFIIDEKYLILLVGTEEAYAAYPVKFKIVVMCSRTLRTLRSSGEVPHHPISGTLSYTNGWVVVVTDKGEIRLYDVKTLICRHIFKESFPIENLVIGRDFLITHGSDRIKIWDFQAMCSGTGHQKNAERTICNTKNDADSCHFFLFDGMQVITCPGDVRGANLVVLDFSSAPYPQHISDTTGTHPLSVTTQ